MANPTAYAVSMTVNPDTFRQDGYVAVGSDGYTQTSTLPINSLIKALARTATGVWTATLQECWPNAAVTLSSPLLRFEIIPVFPTDPGASVLLPVILSDNINTNATLGSGVINFEFLNLSGTKTDLPAGGGFRFSIVLTNGNLYL